VDYKDLHASCASDGYAARVDLAFSTNQSAFGTAIGGLSASGGCDRPESVYSGLMAAIRLPWRDGVTKAVIIMGDAPPHDPEPVTGYTRSSVSAAAIAVDPAALYSINIGGGGSPYFEGLADDTGGRSYLASDPSTAVDQIAKAITAITSSALVADAGGPYSGAAGEPITFDASNSTGATDIASFEWDFNNDGTYDARTSLPTVTYTYPDAYLGKVGLRVTTAGATPETATATASVQILLPTQTRYTGQRAGQNGHSVHLEAFVTDRSGKGVAGVSVVFSLDTQSCTAETVSNGKAICEIVLSQPVGRKTVEADAWPEKVYFPSADSASFNIQH
jgi:hypothetical protein